MIGKCDPNPIERNHNIHTIQSRPPPKEHMHNNEWRSYQSNSAPQVISFDKGCEQLPSNLCFKECPTGRAQPLSPLFLICFAFLSLSIVFLCLYIV